MNINKLTIINTLIKVCPQKQQIMFTVLFKIANISWLCEVLYALAYNVCKIANFNTSWKNACLRYAFMQWNSKKCGTVHLRQARVVETFDYG